MKSKLAGGISGLLIGATITGGAAVAMTVTAGPSTAVMSACVTAKGAMRMVDMSTAKGCTKSEKLVQWNIVGPSGSAGEKGSTGSEGKQGTQGAVGPRGENGAKGEPGIPGAPGVTGANGTGSKGDVGPAGAKGDKGDAGAKGDQGTQGLSGAKGDVGSVGATGAKGDAGLLGLKGDAGVAGQKGDKGDVGANGRDGAIGAKGDKGDIGAKGDQGIQGLQGVKGDAGAVGAKGDPGATGEAGAKGDAGPVGPMPPGFGQNVVTGNTFQGIRDCTMGTIALSGLNGAIGLAADGSLLSIAQNTALFSLFGTTYGGNGNDDLRPTQPDVGHPERDGVFSLSSGHFPGSQLNLGSPLVVQKTGIGALHLHNVHGDPSRPWPSGLYETMAS